MYSRALSRAAHLLLGLCIISCCLPTFAQEIPRAQPESVGLSSERLERIGAAVQREIEGNRIAGAVTLVARKGRIAWLKAQGMMDKGGGRQMPPDAIFRICSMTKPITSAAVMMLYEEGHFLLGDPVSRFIPEFKNPKVLVQPATGEPYTIPAKSEITIRHLLTHTSGLTYHWNSLLGARYRDAGVTHGLQLYAGKIGDNIRSLANLPLLFHPGERFEYGLSIDVLGYLVEVISGMSLDEFLRTRIFEPLGMKDTSFFLSGDKVSRLAIAYTWYKGKGLAKFPAEPIVEGTFSYTADYPYHGSQTLFSGGGGLCSTATDYARFCQMMLNGGEFNGKRLLSRKSIELMTQDQLGKAHPDTEFGLGFGIWGHKAPLPDIASPGRYGWGGFFYTKFFIDPEEEMYGVFMGQLHPSGGLTLDRLCEVLAYQAIVD